MDAYYTCNMGDIRILKYNLNMEQNENTYRIL